MINPDKEYSSNRPATIVKIEPADTYLPYIFIQTADGTSYKGFLKRVHPYWNRLRVGDQVSFTVQYSIMAEAFLIAALVRKKVKNA